MIIICWLTVTAVAAFVAYLVSEVNDCGPGKCEAAAECASKQWRSQREINEQQKILNSIAQVMQQHQQKENTK